MKILITTGVYPPESGGPATYSKLLFDELPKRDIEVDVLPFREVRHLPKGIGHLFYFFKILKRAKGADILYAQDPVSVGFPTVLANKILKKRFLIRIAGDFAWEQGVQRFGVKDTLDVFSAKQKGYGFFVGFFKMIQKASAWSADEIIVPSFYFKKVITNWGIDPEKIKVIYNGIKIPENLERENLERENNMLLSVGRLVPWKGFKVLIEVMPDLLREFPDLKLKIVGDGPQKEELENLIKEKSLENSVFLLGRLEREETLKFMKKSSLYILNTHYEGFAHQLLEVASLKTPIITTNIGGNPELIENNQEGLLVEPNNEEQIKEAVLKILQDFDFRKKITENAYQKVQKFSFENTLNEVEKILEKQEY